jgi:hypothetical protein
MHYQHPELAGVRGALDYGAAPASRTACWPIARGRSKFVLMNQPTSPWPGSVAQRRLDLVQKWIPRVPRTLIA